MRLEFELPPDKYYFWAADKESQHFMTISNNRTEFKGTNFPCEVTKNYQARFCNKSVRARCFYEINDLLSIGFLRTKVNYSSGNSI